MSARRGSLRFKVQRIASGRLDARERAVAGTVRRAAGITGRVLGLAVVALLAANVGTQMWRIGYANWDLHRQITGIESDNARLEADIAAQQREARLLHNDEYLVPFIHEQLGLTKPREVMVQLATPPPRRK